QAEARMVSNDGLMVGVASMLSLCRGAEVFLAVVLACRLASAGELLYNGIELPDDWPPRMQSFARGQPQTPPYLKDPPAVISIDVGRQLLVDDFLIQSTTLVRTYHRPTWHEKSPVLRAETPWEFHGDRNIPFAAPFSDGIWWDPKDQLFKMWYMGGTTVYLCYATSRDGNQWHRQTLGTFRKGTNIF